MPHVRSAIVGQSDNSEAPGAPDVDIRPLLPVDISALVDLWVASWRDAMPAIDFEARRGWIADVLGDAANATLVAVSNDRVPVAGGFAVTADGILHQLVVASSAKGQGVATALLSAVKLRQPTGVALEVNQANHRAVAFYLREGFRPTGESLNPASGLATWTMLWP